MRLQVTLTDAPPLLCTSAPEAFVDSGAYNVSAGIHKAGNPHCTGAAAAVRGALDVWWSKALLCSSMHCNWSLLEET
jgi:hypothetical protein